jgi:hypothetical protein
MSIEEKLFVERRLAAALNAYEDNCFHT